MAGDIQVLLLALFRESSIFGTSPAQTLNITAEGYPTFEYAVKDVATQEDLVAANLINKDRTSGELILPFQHLLTQVNFPLKVILQDLRILLQRLY